MATIHFFCPIGAEKRFKYTVALSTFVGLVNSGEEGKDINGASDNLLKTQESMTEHYKVCKCPESNPSYSPAVMDIELD